MFAASLLKAGVLALCAASAAARSLAGGSGIAIANTFVPDVNKRQTQLMQDIVTWDNESIFIRGERVFLYSGEFHPYRLPNPNLHLDIFQKVKAMGYNAVSFYTDWALLEGKPGEFIAEGIFDFTPFFDAATEAGIYLLARPGPYINAESSGGGFPGWLAKNPCIPRTRDPRYIAATQNYVHSMGEIIAAAQITNGGPVIMLQPENEYSALATVVPFPDPVYWGEVETQYRNANIILPFFNNDNYEGGHDAPGTPGPVDIYGFDNYGFGFTCSTPYTWPDDVIPTYTYEQLHLEQSPSTPFSTPELQGGSFDPWGGAGYDECVKYVGYEFARVWYQEFFTFGITYMSHYMIYGGTNWGNLGYPGVYTSYDYAAAIAEDRTVTREKYSEQKLLANFIRASPSYITAVPQNLSNFDGAFTGDSSLYAARSISSTGTNYYYIRHANYSSLATTLYNFTLSTIQGDKTIPQLGGSLSIPGRDMRVHVSNYDVNGTTLLYSSAQIFTWKQHYGQTVLVLWGEAGETHEFAIVTNSTPVCLQGDGFESSTEDGTVIIHTVVTATPEIITLGSDFIIYVVDRNTAYNMWTIDLPTGLIGTGDPNAGIKNAAVIYGGYLVRTAAVNGTTFSMVADVNATTTFEIISGAPPGLTSLIFNGKSVNFTQSSTGVVSTTVEFATPAITVPDLTTLEWQTIDSLPEIQASYDDSLWPSADLTYSNNTARNLTTPVSLYAQDYGYSSGNLLYRAHFTANGDESTFYVETQGGTAFGHSLWLGDTFLGSFVGNSVDETANQTVTLASDLTTGDDYIITILIDTMGCDENYDAGSSTAKDPRGILEYDLAGHDATDISWKLTGNYLGEDYPDKSRGPRNEGGLYIERKGWHIPGAPTSNWSSVVGGPNAGISAAGVQFYSVYFDLDLPDAYDVPLSLGFTNDSTPTSSVAFRAQVYVNGFQYGKYVDNIGPQTVFPVPPGIWNYTGSNYLGVTLWALDDAGAVADDFSIAIGQVSLSGYGKIANAPYSFYVDRPGSY